MKHFWKHLAKGTLVMLCLATAVQFLEFHGWLASAEGLILDRILGPPGPGSPGDIITLEIDNDGYQRCFGATSPLAPAQVLNIVKAVAGTGAKVVGVDIITDAPRYQALYESVRPATEQKVVWIAGVERAHTPPIFFWNWLMGKHAEAAIRPSPILGGAPVPDRYHWGIPVFPRDDDAGLRRLYRSVTIAADPENPEPHDVRKSLAMTIADLAMGQDKDSSPEETDEPVYVVYGARPPGRFQILDVLPCVSGPNPKGEVRQGALWDAFVEHARDKIVLVGGTYSSARDSYVTPAGLLPGLLVNAYAIQSQLDNQVLHEERRPVSIALDLSIGFLIVLIFVIAEHGSIAPRTALVVSTLVFVGAFAFTWQYPGKEYIPAFAGITLGVLIDQLHGAWELLKKHGE